MDREPLDIRLQRVALGATIAIPLACVLSRFVADLLLILTGLLFLTHSALNRDWRWLRCGWVKVGLLLWVYLIAISLGASDMAGALGRGASWLRFPIFIAALAFWVMHRPGAGKQLIYGLSVAVLFMLADTMVQYWLGRDLFGYVPIETANSPRLTGPFSSPRIGIMLIWMAIPAAAYWLLGASGPARPKWKYAVGSFLVVALITVIFITGERMAFLLTCLAFTIGFFILPISKNMLLALGVITVIAIGLLGHFQPGLFERQMNSTSEVISEFRGSDYGQIWQSGWDIAQDYPLFGTGLRQFRVHCPEAQYGAATQEHLLARCSQHPHNIYLEWLVETGLIGLGLFITVMALISRDLWRAYPLLRANAIYLGLLITIAIRLWPLASSTSFFTAWSAVPFWLMVGWALGLAFPALHAQEKP